MAIFPNYLSSITAYKALNILRKNMPNLSLDTAQVDYKFNTEILKIEISSKQQYIDVCALLGASGSYVENSIFQNFLNLGSYQRPVYESKHSYSDPFICESVIDGGSYAIVDINSNTIVNPKTMERYPLNSKIQNGITHFKKLANAVVEMQSLQEINFPISHLHIIELTNGKFAP